MNEKSNANGKRYALILYILVTMIFLIAAAGFFVINSYFPLKYEDMIIEYADQYGVDENLICAVIATESRFDADAESEKGAIGLMQIMPETGEWISKKIGIEEFAPEMLTDPSVNIEMGVWYLDYLLDRYDFEQDTAIAAYNAGQGNVDGWLGKNEYSADGRTLYEIPFEETRNYVKRVNTGYEIYSTLYKIR